MRKNFSNIVLLICLFIAGCVRTVGIAGNFKNPAPDINTAYRFVAYGDTRTGTEAHKLLVDKILASKPDFIINTGDLVLNGYNENEWREFEKIISPLTKAKIPYYSAIGNHERGSDYFYNLFGLENDKGWYSVEYNTSYLIFLDTNKPFGAGSEQYIWLVKELEKYAAKKGAGPRFLFVAFHHPPYSSGNHGSNYTVRNVLCPLFVKYKADIVFSGHDHAYERSAAGGVNYVVTGGGGAPLYGQSKENEFSIIFKKAHHYCLVNISGNKLQFEAFGIDGEKLDGFEIVK